MLEQLETIHPLLPGAAGLGLLIVAALLADLIVRRGLVGFVHMLAKRSPLKWDDALSQHKVFTRLSHIIPALVVGMGVGLVPGIPIDVVTVTQNVVDAYVVLMIVLALTSALSAGNAVYETYPIARERPLKGIIQVAQILIYIIGAVLIVSALSERSPALLLGGLGAMTAVLLLVFKDTILGLVASVQLTANDMVRVGDWVEMPAYGADGDVLEVALHTVKIQNWDKTITTIPTYKLISESFKNWRGMSESGGRRIKRALHLDQTSIRFLEDEEIARLQSFALLREHIADKQRELSEYHNRLGVDGSVSVNRRRLTNIGVFRAYVRNYLANHPGIHQQMTLLVRQLPPGPQGLPIEIYCFTKTTEWLAYEDLQADIFDHSLAIVSEFGLRLFQNPVGSDLLALKA